MTTLVVAILLSSLAVHAQLTPSPTYNPPPASSGTASSTSTPNTQWSNVLGNSLWFYDAQRSGKLEQGSYGNRVEWRNDSALEDGSDVGLDLTGGFYDAGDYIKATFPLGFALFALSWGALTHGEGYNLANQAAYLDGTLRWGYDWLIKAHPSNDTLYVQVGNSAVDNAYWGGDQGIPDPRTSYPINASFPGTDAWASTAAAFAMAAVLYSPDTTYNITSTSGPPSSPSLANASYSATLLSHAIALYNTATDVTPYTLYSESIPAVASAYGSTSYGDDLAVAALSLALATNESVYYDEAYQLYQNFSLSGNIHPWNWDSRVPALYVLFAEAATARPGLAIGAGLDANLTGWQNEAEAYFDRLVNADNAQIYMTSGGLLYWRDDSRYASLNPAMATAMLMFKYAPMASSTAKANTYTSFAQGQLDYMVGKNPMSSVYLVGSHPNSPQNPSSAPASGGDNINNVRNDPPTMAHVLYGAMVGGPLANDRFWDWRDDWVQTEVAVDYNAMIPTLAAMMLMNGSSDPFYVSVQAGTYSLPSGQPCDPALPCKKALSTGAIVGIIIGVVIAVVLVFGLIGYCFRNDLRRCCGRRGKA